MESFSLQRGFTLIELLVTFSIVGILTAVVITNQNTFNSTIILANTAYDVALSLRSTETYGTGSSISQHPIGYGLHFAKGTPNSYILFADTSPAGLGGSACHTVISGLNAQPGDCVFSGSDLSVRTYTLGNNITISDFCVYDSSNTSSCASTGVLSSLDIVFSRPNPMALISMNGGYSASWVKACITVASPYGKHRYISVSHSGEINANASSCL